MATVMLLMLLLMRRVPSDETMRPAYEPDHEPYIDDLTPRFMDAAIAEPSSSTDRRHIPLLQSRLDDRCLQMSETLGRL